MGSEIKLDNILVTKLRFLSAAGGEVLHVLKKSDQGYKDFGEVYFSTIEPNSIKAWKRHSKMLINFVVPIGEVKFVFYINDKSGFRVEKIGLNRYVRLTVPPGIWFGFKNLSKQKSYVMNIASIIHDPEEVESCPVEHIDFKW